MKHLLRSELFRLRKRPQTWILAIIMVASAGTFYAALTIASFVANDPTDANEGVQLQHLGENGLQIVTIVGFILTVVMASGLIGNEYGWNTIRPLVARSRSRGALLGAKWLTVLISSVGLYAIGLVATLLFSAVGSMIAGVFEGPDIGLLATWGLDFLRLLFSQLPYVCLAFVLALVARSNATGIAVGLGMAIAEPLLWSLLGLVTDAFEPVRKFGIEYPSTLLFDLNSDYAGYTTREAWQATIVLSVWMALMVVISFAVFRRRDVTSG